VKENSASGSIVGSPLKYTDKDLGSQGHGQGVFSIVDGDVNNVFAIDPATGQISKSANGGGIDYELKPNYYLTVQILDTPEIGERLSDVCSVTVNIVDVNEKPSIEDAQLSVREDAQTGAIVGLTTATDVDATPNTKRDLVYSIIGGSGQDVFSIVNTTGQVLVADSGQLDFETIPTWTLKVSVTDGEFTDSATVTISVTDVNEAPILRNATFVIAEDSKLGTEVGKLGAVDPDGDALGFKVIAGDPKKTFSVLSSDGGTIVVANPGIVSW
jgi:hypothetical protein